MEHKIIEGVHVTSLVPFFCMFLHTSVYALPFCVAVSCKIKWQLYKDINCITLEQSGNFCCTNIFMVLHKP